MNFSDMSSLDPAIISALRDHNIVSPTEIQRLSLDAILSASSSSTGPSGPFNSPLSSESIVPSSLSDATDPSLGSLSSKPSKTFHHVVGQAKTGSGKTLAFAIPIIQHLNPNNKHVQALILVPTRELCKQVSAVFRMVSKYKTANIVEIYGGVSITRQIEELRRGGQIVIATPGRLIDLYHQRQIGFKHIKYVALDEADRMLDMGFLPDIRIILLEAMKNISPQLMLYSATLAPEIRGLVKKFTRNHEILEIDVSKDELVVDQCTQSAYIVAENKYWSFVRILKAENPEYCIIFTKTKRKAQEISKRLARERDLPLKVAFLNGDVSQAQREEIVRKFRAKEITCLVGTNVLARGLDFPRVTHVFNYDLPRDPENYVHRIGRTARVSGSEKNVLPGKAISIVSSNDMELLRKIEKLIDQRIKQCDLPGVTSQPPAETSSHHSGRSYARSSAKKTKSSHSRPQSRPQSRSNSQSNPAYPTPQFRARKLKKVHRVSSKTRTTRQNTN